MKNSGARGGRSLGWTDQLDLLPQGHLSNAFVPALDHLACRPSAPSPINGPSDTSEGAQYCSMDPLVNVSPGSISQGIPSHPGPDYDVGLLH